MLTDKPVVVIIDPMIVSTLRRAYHQNCAIDSKGVPGAATRSMPDQMAPVGKSGNMVLNGIAADPGNFGYFADGDASVLSA